MRSGCAIWTFEVCTLITLERMLHRQGFGVRRECRKLVRQGRVRVMGQVVLDPDCSLSPEGLSFEVDDETWHYRTQVYVMLNKPAGYECSRAPRHHPGVLGLLPSPLPTRGVQPVGRLDQDTTGLLLLSDDGQFIHQQTSPRHHIPRQYRVTTRQPLTDAQLAALRDGVRLHDQPRPVAALACEMTGAHELLLTLAEGRYHQVRRMLAAAGNHVQALQRVRIGALSLPADLAPGQWRWLTDAELAAVRHCGLPPAGV